MEQFPDGMKVGDLKRLLATWNDEAEVWLGDGLGHSSPARMFATCGPDSTGCADAAYIGPSVDGP